MITVKLSSLFWSFLAESSFLEENAVVILSALACFFILLVAAVTLFKVVRFLRSIS